MRKLTRLSALTDSCENADSIASTRHHLWQRWTGLADDNMAALSDECSRQQTTVSDGSICESVERADGFPTPRAHPEALVSGGL